jgi:hypothetical protein
MLTQIGQKFVDMTLVSAIRVEPDGFVVIFSNHLDSEYFDNTISLPDVSNFVRTGEYYINVEQMSRLHSFRVSFGSGGEIYREFTSEEISDLLIPPTNNYLSIATIVVLMAGQEVSMT